MSKYERHDTGTLTPVSINPREVERYNALAETWWDADGAMWPLHALNRRRAPWVAERIARHFQLDRSGSARYLQGVSVLDIGCGGGLLSEEMARRGARVTGVDPADRNILIARAHARCNGLDIDYRVGSVEQVAWQRFDVVLNMEVVEHVEQQAAFIAECSGLVRDGGLHFLATINRTARAFVMAIVGAEYITGWLPRGTHQWRKFVTPDEVQAALENSACEVLEWSGVRVDPLAKKCLLSESLSVNYMLAATRRNAG